MKANETFFDARQTQQTRSLTYNLLIQLGFPDFVTASVSITPFAPVLLDAFIISQMYTASTGTGIFSFFLSFFILFLLRFFFSLLFFILFHFFFTNCSSYYHFQYSIRFPVYACGRS